MPFEVDLAYYKDEYKGETSGMSDEELTKNINRALETVHIITKFKLQNGLINYDNLLEWQKVNLKKAVCVIAEQYIVKGGYISATQSELSSVSLGGFNYSTGGVSHSGRYDLISVPEMALELIRSSGLLFSGIDVC